MKRIILKSLLLSVICGFWAFPTTAVVSLFSDYGQIQNVQNYSSNPFWSPNAPYNQRLPQPVFAMGADLNAGDCQRVVQSLVSAQCMARDNCKNSDISDIRPIVMVQLSNLPGHNYVSACGGYIDGAVESYKRQYGNALPNKKTDFPSPTTPNLNTDDSNGIQFENPYKIQPTKWQLEQKERSDELQSLQRQNGYGSNNLAKTNFPATYADLSFSERIENDRAGLEPFKDLKAYKTLNVKTTEEWCTDGEHANSVECWEWRCGTNGKDAKKTECVTYRCSKPDYYNANTDECKRNELCVPNNNSAECMRYRCYETDDANLAECIEWKCKNDASFNAEHQDECTEENGGGSDGGSGSTSNDNAGIIINNNGAGNINDDNGEYYHARIVVGNNHEVLKTDAYNKCFHVCDTTLANNKIDKLNKEAFSFDWWKDKPNNASGLITSYANGRCADPTKNGILVGESSKTLLQMTKEQKDELIELITNKVADKGGCDWSARKIYMEIGKIPAGSSYTSFKYEKRITLDE